MIKVRTLIKFSIIIALTIAAIYFSVYIKPLDKVREEQQLREFKPDEFARNFWDNLLEEDLNHAVDAAVLLDLAGRDIEKAVEQFGRTLGISNVSNFLVRGEGSIVDISDDYLTCRLCNGSDTVLIKTGLVFGNIIRDCSGQINIDDFENSMDFNNISVEINKIVNTEIIPPVKERAKMHDTVNFTGAVSISTDYSGSERLEIIPIKIVFIDACRNT